MSKHVRLFSRLRVVFAPLMAVALIAYFSYHLVNGDRGLLAYRDLSLAIAQGEAIKSATGAEREVLERRVSLLRPESLDLDMLEERSRIILDLALPGDIILFNNTL
ncbi:FtsB family cell division protein [Oleispirillum naphthae]|uniref:FtsB family cell division protein n=1 Tax=Oleispirillum naphthae TaxID=2838853 RepID=UPI0030825625